MGKYEKTRLKAQLEFFNGEIRVLEKRLQMFKNLRKMVKKELKQ